VRSLFGPALLLSAMMLAGCEYDATVIGPPPPDAAPPPRTEDEKLAAFGRQLAGSWRGNATWQGGFFFFSSDTAYFELTWTPDPDNSRSGELTVCAVPPEGRCGSGQLYLNYNLYELEGEDLVKGLLDTQELTPGVDGYAELELIPQKNDAGVYDGSLNVTVRGGLFNLNGPFWRVAPSPVPDAGPDAAFR
jgi:hypothetical protein